MSAFWGLLFPPHCVLCRAQLPTETEAMVCPDCAAAVRREYRQTDGVRVAGTDDAAAALRYRDKVRFAMHRYKFRHAKSYARWFAAHTAPVLAERLDAWKPDVITYVPLGFFRWHKRGYNQSELIARLVARQLGLPCEKTLAKRPFAARQSKKSGDERRKSARSAFRLAGHAAVQGRRIVLVDDVLTTGSTLSAGAALLREAGAAKIYALAVTKTP